MNTWTCLVSVPPTDNQRLGHGRGKMWRTVRYKRFLQELSIVSKKPKTPFKYVDVVIEVKVNYRLDAHNLIKSTLDGLQEIGVLLDDRYVISTHITRRATCEQGKMQIKINECERV